MYINYIIETSIHRKNEFAEISKNLIRYRSENNFVRPQNNCVRNLNMMSNAAKNFDILSVWASYMIILTKLFSDLYLAKFLDTSTKSFFPCNNKKICRVKSKACSIRIRNSMRGYSFILSLHCVKRKCFVTQFINHPDPLAQL